MNRRERRLPFEGAVNFRDVGGYPAAPGRRVRWRRLYRSDNLGAMTARDGELLVRVSLRTIVDFRIDKERDLHPSRLPAGGTIETIRLSFLPVSATDMLRDILRGDRAASDVEAAMATQYRSYVADHLPEYRALFEPLLSDDRLPILIHCTSGKDRTGFAIALVLLAIGATPATALEDYLLTNRYRRDIGHLFGPATSPEVIDAVMSARESYLAAAFDEIEKRYGSVDSYLERGLGLDDEARTLLSEHLTEPDDLTLDAPIDAPV